MSQIIGIDEVGRGPIAGPVCVGSFMSKVESLKSKARGTRLPLRDSKKLTREQREAWFKIIKLWKKEGKCDFAVSYVGALQIDKIGLSKSIQKALNFSLMKLIKPRANQLVLLDGGLHAPKEFKNQKTIIKGDEKELAIMFASIVAKVHRDRLMLRHAKKFPKYGFENHVGYGTKAHYKAIKKHGLTPLHRRSFLKNFVEK